MTFVKMLGDIQSMAGTMIKNWGDYFAVDELVNEAWINSPKNEEVDAPLIMRRAKLDMIDYIRTHVGRKDYVLKKTEKVVKGRKYIRLLTNAESKDKDGEIGTLDGWLHKPFINKGFIEVDNKELISLLLKRTTTRRAEIMINYYFNEYSLKESARLLNISESRGSGVLKEAYQECRENSKIMGINLQCVEI